MAAAGDNPTLGKKTIELGGVAHTLQFTWEELAELESRFGGNPPIHELDALAEVAALGLRQHHPDITAARIIKISPPVFILHSAVSLALRYAYWGNENPSAPSGEEVKPGKKPRLWRRASQWLSATVFRRQSSGG